MSILELAPPARPDLPPQTVDAFSYFLDVASKIRGLGGATGRPDLNYAFHTFYERCALGRCSFEVQLDGLTATRGLLTLQVNMLSIVPGSHAKPAVIERIPLTDLANKGGRTSVRFESLRGQFYALFGQVLDETDAHADNLTVTLHRPGYPEDHWDPAEEIAPSAFGNGRANIAERLTGDAVATLAAPVSQPCTARQLGEAAFRQEVAALGERPGNDRRQWERAYALRVLDVYGMIAPGARGLFVGRDPGGLPQVLAARGCEVVVADLVANEGEELPSIALRTGFGEQGPTGDLGFFDFVCAIDAMTTFPDPSAALRFAEGLIDRLRPGGLAVHLFPFIRDADPIAAWYGPTRALSRGDVEQFALGLISHSCDVAQLRFELGSKPIGRSTAGLQLTSFGLVARRPLPRRG